MGWRDSLYVTCGLTACTPGSARAQRSVTSMGKLYLYTARNRTWQFVKSAVWTEHNVKIKFLKEMNWSLCYCYLFSGQCETAGCPCVPAEAGRLSTCIDQRRRTLPTATRTNPVNTVHILVTTTVVLRVIHTHTRLTALFPGLPG